jgi:MULE transposase domain
MQNNNPGTKVEWFTVLTNNSNYRFFQGICWAFGPAIRAFKHCRPVIGIDATFLSGRYKGRLMTACGYDAEDQLVPLAFGLFDKETNLSWERFMKFIRQKVIGSRVVCVISDRHASILRVFREADLGWHEDAREAFHRYCFRHICQNFQRHFKDKKLTKRVRFAIRQNQPRKFQMRMRMLEQKNPKAVKWLNDIGRVDENHDPRYDLWAYSYDQGGRRWKILTTNSPELLNNVFKEARELPVTSIIEITFYKSVKYFTKRRTRAEQNY